MGETFTDMIPINHIVQQLIDWTDVRRLRGDNHPNKSIHFGMVRALTHYCFEELPGILYILQ